MAGPSVLNRPILLAWRGRGIYHYARIGENVRSQPCRQLHFRAMRRISARLRATLQLDLLFYGSDRRHCRRDRVQHLHGSPGSPRRAALDLGT